MKKFILLLIIYCIFVIIFIFVSSLVSSYFVQQRDFNNHSTESNLLIIKENLKYNFLMMGISHAREFSRHSNHLRVDSILNKKFINIGIGAGICSVNEQYFYAKYFFKRQNMAEKVIYILSPPMLFNYGLNNNYKTFENEPFVFDFFADYLLFETEKKAKRLVEYVMSKQRLNWLLCEPFSYNKKRNFLAKIDSNIVKKGFNVAYTQDGYSEGRLKKSCLMIEKTIQLALANDSEFIFIIPPALFGKWIGHHHALNFAKQMELKYGVKTYDCSESVLKPEYYYDHHHLNSDGVSFFTENYLKKILHEK